MTTSENKSVVGWKVSNYEFVMESFLWLDQSPIFSPPRGSSQTWRFRPSNRAFHGLWLLPIVCVYILPIHLPSCLAENLCKNFIAYIQSGWNCFHGLNKTQGIMMDFTGPINKESYSYLLW